MGQLVPDAYLAALAIERDARMCTADRAFSRFTGLRWRHPFDVEVAAPGDADEAKGAIEG